MKALDVIKRKARPVVVPSDDAPKDTERFLEALDEACIAERGEPRKQTAFSPSALGMYSGKCQRRFVYIFRGVEPVGNIDARTTRVFANGTAVHERLQSLIDSMGMDSHESEIRLLNDDPPIRSYADDVIVLPWNKKKILLELKSINDNGFNSRIKWNKGKDEHYAQANIYAYLMDIDTIWIIYENKNDQTIAIYEHKADKKKAEKQLDIWRNTWKMFQEGRLPKRPWVPTSNGCMFCDMREHCLSDPEVGE